MITELYYGNMHLNVNL